jgi:3-oxoacyl-[acyl-carrier-protein] synthase-1
MRRVVVTGMGVVSCLGNDKASVSDALRHGRSGIRFNQAFA